MKIFVSGQLSDKSNIKAIYSKFESAGHMIAHDWTKTEDIPITLENKAELAGRASKDLDGVVGADVYVLASDSLESGKGMYVELGMALAVSQLQGRPLVYVVGKLNHPSLFYFHPSVILKTSIEEVIEELDKIMLPRNIYD